MIIEFYTPDQQVNEWTIKYVRDAILKLHNQHKEISRAEVKFRDAGSTTPKPLICEINISIFGDAILVTGEGENFDQAGRNAVAELKTTIDVNFRPNAEPPDEQISTVRI